MPQGTDEVLSCRQVWEEMNALTAGGVIVRNFHRRISMNRGFLVETDLFPREALIAYSEYNLGQPVSDEQHYKYFSEHRGGLQGDYREGIQNKIANVIDCLTRFPLSKRAIITVPNDSNAPHTSDADAKCLREIHFYLDKDDDKKNVILNATVLMRAQAAEIFPKNIHFIGRLMEYITQQLAIKGLLTGSDYDADFSRDAVSVVEIGELFYLATTLVSVRW
ncbi:hypothetical protein ACHAXA_000695 [Cyclostephanos tholiformis]|jgi:hypothetical protein|uniref:Uncharacterized protein n=1 Tax=Cyclostephanos tholiformis TaxID=382380 RepID=A0ABD3R235_9STRA